MSITYLNSINMYQAHRIEYTEHVNMTVRWNPPTSCQLQCVRNACWWGDSGSRLILEHHARNFATLTFWQVALFGSLLPMQPCISKYISSTETGCKSKWCPINTSRSPSWYSICFYSSTNMCLLHPLSCFSFVRFECQPGTWLNHHV